VEGKERIDDFKKGNFRRYCLKQTAARAVGLFTWTYPFKEDEMELDINTLIPIGTFAVSMIWLAVVVLFEHYTTAK
jgi:hypothetical protein